MLPTVCLPAQWGALFVPRKRKARVAVAPADQPSQCDSDFESIAYTATFSCCAPQHANKSSFHAHLFQVALPTQANGFLFAPRGLPQPRELLQRAPPWASRWEGRLVPLLCTARHSGPAPAPPCVLPCMLPLHAPLCVPLPRRRAQRAYRKACCASQCSTVS